MKKTLLISFLAFAAFAAKAQFPQNFDGLCASGNTFPATWIGFSPMSIPDSLKWHCSDVDGRNATGGMECTGYYNALSYLDTDYLISPEISPQAGNFSGNMYINFDTKTSMFPAANIDLIVTTDSNLTEIDSAGINETQSVNPVFGNGDASDWVTHQANITPYKDSIFYVAFRYTSAAGTIGSIWYLDNILFTSIQLGVVDANKQTLPFTVVGTSTPEQIKISYSVKDLGTYNLGVYDIVGREVYKSTINAAAGKASYTISGLHLNPGMYFIKMGNGKVYGAAKAVVE